MNGNREDLMRLVEEEDDQVKKDTFEHLYKTAYDEYNRFFAQSIWEWQGRVVGKSLDFWLAGQNVTTAWYLAWFNAPWWSSISSDKFREMKEFIPIKLYLDVVNNLANELSDHADRCLSAPKDFWIAAEKTALAIMNAALAATKSADEIRTRLMKEFEQFSSAIYLQHVKEAAYLGSEERQKAGRQADMLSDWLEAEGAAQEKLRQGERIATKSAEPGAQK